MTKIYGVPLSPFVRKVLTVLELKGIDYELEPVTPLDLPQDFEEISPLRKIPGLVDDQLTVSDSSIICEYLEERYPQPSVLPASLPERARCRWYEEFADTRMVEAIGPPLFWERVVKPMFLKEPTDEARVQDALENLWPPVMNYLESQVPGAAFMFGESLTVADIAINSPIVNAGYARESVDAARWPKLAAYIEFIQSQPVVVNRMAAEKSILGG